MMEKNNKNKVQEEKDIREWMAKIGLKSDDVEEWKANHRGIKLISIYPYDDIEEMERPEEADVVRFFVRPLKRKETELIAQKSIKGQDIDIRTANKMTLQYCVLGGDSERLEEGPVYTGLLQEIGEINQAKSSRRKNY